MTASTCDYSDVRHFRFAPSRPGLADEGRHQVDVEREVNLAVCRVYNRLRACLETDYCWILEDDIIPPDDVLSRLLSRFDRDVACVSAPYRSRFDGLPVVWNGDAVPNGGTPRIAGGRGVQAIRGSGFGCIVIRSRFLNEHVFSLTLGERYYDPYFFRMLGDGWKRLCDWSCWCQHLGQGGSRGTLKAPLQRSTAEHPVTLTIVVILHGRTGAWPHLRSFLERNHWPWEHAKLVVIHLGRDQRFGRRVARWIGQGIYPDSRYLNRLAPSHDYRLVTPEQFAKPLATIAAEISSDWSFWMSDESLPPNDAVTTLSHEMEQDLGLSSLGAPASPITESFTKNGSHNFHSSGRNGNGSPDSKEPSSIGCLLMKHPIKKTAFKSRGSKGSNSPVNASSCHRLTQHTICQPLENDLRPCMLEDHWPESWENIDLTTFRSNMMSGSDVENWILAAMTSRDPIAIASLGDGDVAWWCLDSICQQAEVDRHWVNVLALTSGLHPQDRATLWQLFDEACRNSPHWLVQTDWEPAERFVLQSFLSQGITVQRDGFVYAGDKKQKIACNPIYELLDHGTWWSILAGKRLAVVGDHAAEFAKILMDEHFVRRTGGAAVQWNVATALTSPDETVAKNGHWRSLDHELRSSDWDLLLCAAGGLSIILCDRACQMGRKALDIGHLINVFLAKEALTK